MDDEQNAALHLGGLALGNVLRDLGIDEQHQSDLERLGIASGSGRIKQEDIYNDRFADDDNDFGDAYQRNGSSTKDWETEVDDEMRKELDGERDSEERAELDRYYRQGLAQLEQPRAPLRGEDDDFDDDESDKDEDVPLSQQPSRGQTNGQSTQANGVSRFGEGMIKVKQERDDDSDMAFLSAPMASSSSAAPSTHTPLVLPTAHSPRQGSPQTPPPSHQPYMSGAPPPRPFVDMEEVKQHFPDFEPGKILNFTELFATRPSKKRKLGAPSAKFHITPEDELPIPQSTREQLLQSSIVRPHHALILPSLTRELHSSARGPHSTDATDEDIELAVISTPGVKAEKRSAALAPVELDDWEDRIVWDPMNSTAPMQIESIDKETDLVQEEPAALAPPAIDKPFNHDLYRGAWTRGIIWDAHTAFEAFGKLVLDMNDPQMMLEEDFGPKTKQNSLLRSDAPVVSAAAQRDLARRQAELDPLNLSNDKFYEQTREHRQRVRQTLGKLVVQHAWPAIKLQLPWYKTKLTKAEARSFHRPAMQFPTNMPLHFSKTISSKRRRKVLVHAKPRTPTRCSARPEI